MYSSHKTTLLLRVSVQSKSVEQSYLLFQVETIGDAYMIVGGVPHKTDEHAFFIAKMAFAMLTAMVTLKDPSDKTGRGHLRLRIGMTQLTLITTQQNTTVSHIAFNKPTLGDRQKSRVSKNCVSVCQLSFGAL